MLNGRFSGDSLGNYTCVANNGVSTVDYMICSSELFPYICDFSVLENDESVHFPIYCEMCFQCKTNINICNDTIVQLSPFNHYRWKTQGITTFHEKFENLYEIFKNKHLGNDILVSNKPVLDDFINVYKLSGKTMQCYIKRGYKRKNTWWDDDCNSAKLRVRRSLRRFRLSNCRNNLVEYKIYRSEYKSICRKKHLIHQYNLRNELINNRKDAKRFWSILKSVSITRKDTTLSACKLYEHFKQLLNNDLTNVDLDSSFLQTIRINPGCDELNNQITQQEIIQSVKTFKSNKSPGPDGICMEMYKNTLNDILPFLHKLFNDTFDTSSFPDDWSGSIITPLHKKGSVSNPDNYRGISLIDSICKIFMHILSSRLSNCCEHYHVIDESQAGFRKGYSTVDNIFILTSLIQKYLSKKRDRFFCIFIDFKKAFDSIRHDKLWDALERKGIKGKFLDTIKSMYKKLKSCVKIDGNLTPYFDCSIGTRQGCVASPKIFSLFINDLVDYLNIKNERGIFVTQDINELNVLMFADDVSSFADTVVQLQRQIK